MTDPGLSTQRTALAWQRTSLTVVVLASIVAKLHLTEQQVLPLIPTTVSLLLGLAVLVEAWLRDRRRTGHRPGPARGGRMSALLALAVLVLFVGELVGLLQR
jgi:uncharacterized membrane protein YidH (DUF202 family)